MTNMTSSRGVNVPSSGIRPGPSARTQDTRNATKADQSPRAARRPAPLLDTPCYGKTELFDSVEFADHHEAKTLCAHCPVLTSCVLLLEDVLRSTKPYGGPDGTWAGRGFNIGRKPGRPKPIGIEQARRAHAAYGRGERHQWVIDGERQYQRNRKRTTRRKGEAA